MTRAFLLVLDSFGCGNAPDAADFGDAGADTFGHIAEACATGLCDVPGLRSGPLRMPLLDALGLGAAALASTGRLPPGFSGKAPTGAYGYAIETSLGKDTPTGHWDIAGAPADFKWGYFPDREPSIPESLIDALVREGHLPGVIGNVHASGTAILEDLGAEHGRSGKPIVYTSSDSVLQIAAHEESFGRERLYDLCRIARRLCDPLHIGRIIARPFIGSDPSTFKRTQYRKDFSLPPPEGTVLDRAAAAGRAIVSVGKIGDIFAHRNTGLEIKGRDDMDLFDKTLEQVRSLPDGGLLFANYVDLDTDFGHRRNVAGYAAGLERFDARMGELVPVLRPGDLCILTADHGNDPTWRGTDHTREHVPVLAFGPGIKPVSLGGRGTFADIGASVARHLGITAPLSGRAWQDDQ
jgi:phosphopentomutase